MKRFVWKGSHGSLKPGITPASMDTEYVYNALRVVINTKFPWRIPGSRVVIDDGTYEDQYLRDAYGAFTRALRRRGDPRYRVSDPEVVQWFENKKENKMSKQKVVINVGTSAALAELVQEILFKAGYRWAGGGKEVRNLKQFGFDAIEAGYSPGLMTYAPYKSYVDIQRTYYPNHAFLDATTDLSKLVELLSKPATVEVKLNAEYTAVVGKEFTQVADQKIPNDRILAIAKQIESLKK